MSIRPFRSTERRKTHSIYYPRNGNRPFGPISEERHPRISSIGEKEISRSRFVSPSFNVSQSRGIHREIDIDEMSLAHKETRIYIHTKLLEGLLVSGTFPRVRVLLEIFKLTDLGSSFSSIDRSPFFALTHEGASFQRTRTRLVSSSI